MFQYRSILSVVLATFLSGAALSAAAQEGALASLKSSFQNFASRQVQEKLFVHTDKPFYLAGELVWFKIYGVSGATHQPLSLSKVAYVELLDGANQAVMQAKVSLEEGEGSGSLLLPSSVSTGAYRLRAYTAWMQNGDPAFFFAQDLTIINTLKPGYSPVGADTVPATAAFYPEGGQLVAGLQSQVGFRVADLQGRGQQCTGFVVSDRNDTVARFVPHKLGIGRFSFTPEEGRSYRALVRMPDGKQITEPLPQVQEKGFVLHVQQQATGKLLIEVQGSSPDGLVYLLAHTRQQLKWAGQAVLRNGRTRVELDTALLGEGISQITLFNAQQQPVSERLVFKMPIQKLAITTTGMAPVYETRKQVNVQLDTRGGTVGVPASLSVAVYRLDSLTAPNGFDMVSYLWLASDLKGVVESPGFYFREQSEEVVLALDNLMLTHGWRRFRWSEVLQPKGQVLRFLPEYNGPIVKAKVLDAFSGQPSAAVPAFLSIPGVQLQFYAANSDSAGNVFFHTRPFWGAGELIGQAKNDETHKYRLEFVSPFSTQFTAPPQLLHYSPGWHPQLVSHSVGTQVQNTFAAKNFNRFVLPHVDSLPFYGQPSRRYLLDDYTRFTTMEEVLREYVAEIAVRKRGDQWILPVSQGTSPGFFTGPSLVLLDGVPLFDNNPLMRYDPLKVRKIEVVTSRYFYGSHIFEGVINFTTYNGTLDGFDLDPSAVVVDYEGLQLQREFAQPDYTDAARAASKLPDFRSLLYWNPKVRTDAGGKANLSFFTSDRKGNFLTVVQGMDAAGKCGAGYVGFEVR